MTDLANSTTGTQFHSGDDFPPAREEVVDAYYDRILGRHLFTTIRKQRGLTQQDVADAEGVTKAAINQRELRDLGSLTVNTILKQLTSCGYSVDGDWLVQAITNALPVDPNDSQV